MEDCDPLIYHIIFKVIVNFGKRLNLSIIEV